MEKQGIEKVLEDFASAFPELRAPDEEGGMWSHDTDDVTEEVQSFLRSAIETAFKEVRPKKLDEGFNKTEQKPTNDEIVFTEGYNQAISDYDQAVDKFLGK